MLTGAVLFVIAKRVLSLRLDKAKAQLTKTKNCAIRYHETMHAKPPSLETISQKAQHNKEND